VDENPLTFCTFKWRPAPGYRSHFTGEHVNTLARMIRRHYSKPHRFVVITDDPAGITEPGIEAFEIWQDHARVPNPSGRGNPSCYRRLRLFAPAPGKFLGPRFVCVDLDTVITADITPLFDRPEDFVIWKSTTSTNPYNGSMFMLRAGTRPQVWMDFDPGLSPMQTRRAGFFGSDQAWLAHCLGPDEAVWTKADGVLSYRVDVGKAKLPEHARIVFFHGREDPWSREAQRLQWVKEHWR
jgi:hypothetical protein